MERIAHKANSFEEADEYDIIQQISMTVEQRQEAAKKIKEHYYGNNVKDVKDSYKDGR